MTVTRLVSLGNVVIDIVTRIAALPERGGDVIADSGEVVVGGSAYTVLVAAARQGLPGVYAGAHGTGPFGALARAGLAREGIAVAHAPVAGLDTGFDVAMVEADGERTFVTAVGAEGRLSLGAFSPSPFSPGAFSSGASSSGSSLSGAFSFAPGDAVHLSGYGLLHPVNRETLLAVLPAIEGLVVYDPGPLGHEVPASVIADVVARTDWWSGNAREARLATGIEDPAGAAVALASWTRAGAIVRLGADGCIVAERRGTPRLVPGFTVAAVDLNGAGDTHVGTFIAGIASGLGAADAAHRANAAAAIAVTRPGPSDAPTRGEVDGFLRRTSE
jgi:sugar/nucleoside kinase (ribokinase family)